MRIKAKGAGTKTIYVTDPEIWKQAMWKATLDNKSLSQVIQELLERWIME